MNRQTELEKQLVVPVIALLMCFSAHASIAQTLVAEPQYRFQHFDTKDGLPAESIQSIAQDSLGFIWFGYYGSLSRFDGYTFKSYRHDPNDTLNSLPFGVVKGMWSDPLGDLWVFVESGTVHKPSTIAKYNIKTDGFTKYPKPDFPGCIADRTEPLVNWCIRQNEPGLFRHDMKTRETKKYVNDLGDSLLEARSNTIVDVIDLDSILWIASQEGLWIFDKKDKTFKRPPGNPADTALLNHTVFQYIEGPRPNVIDGQLWIWDNQKMLKLDHAFRIVKRFDFPDGFRPASFARDKEGVCWFTSWYPQYRGGLYRYDPRDNSFVVIKNIPGDETSLKSNNLVWVFVDRDQNVWTGGSAHGVSRLQRQALSFHNYKFPNIIGPSTVYRSRDRDFVVVGHVKKFGYGEGIWAEMEILMAPIIHDQLDSLKFKSIATFSGSKVLSYFKGKNNFWISAIGSPMFSLPIDPESGMILNSEPKDRKTIRSQSGVMWEDQHENFWFARYDGLHKISLTSPDSPEKHYMHKDDDPSSIANNGLYSIVPNHDESFFVVQGCCVDLFHNEKFEHVFSGHLPSSALVATDSTLFIGAIDGLHEGKRLNGQYRFVRHTSILLNDILRIQEDKLGRLWLSTPKGIVYYDRNQKIEIEFNKVNGFNHYRVFNDVHERVNQTSRGLIVMSDEDGISIFDPLSLKINEAGTAPVFTSLKVNNQVTSVGDGVNKANEFSIRKNVSVLDELILDYRHNNFSIEFSAMELTAPEKNIYRHQLEGFDKDWIETDYKTRTASYTNLDAGTYTFRVKASNHHGVWSEEERTLKVIVLPPPWRTWWAYMGYSIIFIGLLIWARRNIVQRERLKSNLQLAKIEQEKEHFELEKAKEVDKVKSTFFANISHEFRTPLTLIKGPVQEMMEEFAGHPKVKERMNLVQRNADLVLKLINQLLDLARLESGTLTVDKSQNDLNAFLRIVTSSFSSLAFQKNITLETELPQERKTVSFDKGKVETILINLINNAIKFTPAGGRINVRALLNNDELTLVVEDSGIGIEKDQHEKIFERFYQVSEAHKEVGTGIGLSLVKELVALMKGTLSLKSEPGKGSEFTVTLPVEVTQLLAVEEENTELEPQHVSIELTHSFNGNGKEPQVNRPSILVVEDNSDLRKFIIDSLGKEFQFQEAADGKKGLQTAIDETPDLIISDVMMPEMDGITMTGKLKKDPRTSHIPLILLTAKTTDESKLSGLSTGADDYLTKPFNKQELLLKVRNSISLQVKLRDKVRLELLKESPKVEVQSADEKFLLKVKETIIARLNDEQLSVESLAVEIALSRSQLLRKVTALTGLSVNELIRTFRLQKAAQLLEQNWGPVTQVAYEVGFSNLSYFSKVFKEQYGVMPSEYPVKTM